MEGKKNIRMVKQSNNKRNQITRLDKRRLGFNT